MNTQQNSNGDELNYALKQQLMRNDSELELGFYQEKNQENKIQGKKKKGCCWYMFCCFCCFAQSDEESENEKQLKIQNKQLKSEVLKLRTQIKKQASETKQIQTDQIQKTHKETMMKSITLQIQKISDLIINNKTKKNNQTLEIELQILQQSCLLTKHTQNNQQNQTINQQTLFMPQQYQQNPYYQSPSVAKQDQINLNTNNFQYESDKQFQSPLQTYSTNPPSGIYNQIQSGSPSNDQGQYKSNKIKILSKQNNNQQQFSSNSQPQSNNYYNQQRDYQPYNVSLLSQNSNSNSQPASLINSYDYNYQNQEVNYQQFQEQKQYNTVAQNSDQKIDSQFPQKQQGYQIQEILEISKSSLQNSPRNSLDVMQTQAILSSCYYCQNVIYESSIQTKCQHQYHVSCFAEFIYSQVFSQKLPYIKCICYTKLSLNMLYHINLQDQGQIRQQIFKNQLQQLCSNIQQRGIMIFYCENNCNFFYISQRGQSSICQNCAK